MSAVKEKLDWIVGLQARQLARIEKHNYVFERFPRDIVANPPKGDAERWEALAFAEYNDIVELALQAKVLVELLRVERDLFGTVFLRCITAIDTAIYNEDGLDGAEGQAVLKDIADAQAVLEDAGAKKV
jgi:hypothetical protein